MVRVKKSSAYMESAMHRNVIEPVKHSLYIRMSVNCNLNLRVRRLFLEKLPLGVIHVCTGPV